MSFIPFLLSNLIPSLISSQSILPPPLREHLPRSLNVKMQFTTNLSLTIVAYCAAVAAIVLPKAQELNPIYGEHEHRVYTAHPHFKRESNTVIPLDYDRQQIWRDPAICGYSHGYAFSWIDDRYYSFRHPENKQRKTSIVTELHMWADERVNRIRMVWDDQPNGSEVGRGGIEVPNSPMKLSGSFFVNGMVSGCCQKAGKTRLCHAEFTTNKDDYEKTPIYGGHQTQYWRTSKPACCRAVAGYGHSGDEIDSFQLAYIKLHSYNEKTQPMPGYPGQKRLGRRAFTVGQQSNKRAMATEIRGDHKPEQYATIDHADHVEDNYRISKIVTYCSDRVEGIQLTYVNLENPTEIRTSEFHGKRIGQLREMDLEKGDYIHTVDNSECNDTNTSRSQVCGLVFHTFLMQQHACGQSTVYGKSQSVADHAMLSINGAHEDEILKSIGINWIPVVDHH